VEGNYKYMHSRNSPSFDRIGTDRIGTDRISTDRQVLTTNKMIRLLVNNLRFTCLVDFIATVKYL
jgi:hypothetical protein